MRVLDVWMAHEVHDRTILTAWTMVGIYYLNRKMCHVIGLCPPHCDTLCTSGFTDGIISARKLEEEVTRKAHVLKPAQQAAARIGHSD